MAWTPWDKVKSKDFTDIIYEKKFREEGGGVARITINRPHKLNAFTRHTMDEMIEALDEASHDETVGVVVLTGAGDKAFCTGGDMGWESSPSELRRAFYNTVGMDSCIRMCRKPVIAAVKGWCIGGGNHMAYSCELTMAADNAVFGQTGPRVGSIPGGWTVAQLTRVVGAKKAREMWLLCKRYSAKEALDMGLVNAVVPLDKLDEEVDKWCDEILQGAPDSIAIIKASFNSDIDYMTGTQGLHSRLMVPNWFEGEPIKEAQKAWLEKRRPNFWKPMK